MFKPHLFAFMRQSFPRARVRRLLSFILAFLLALGAVSCARLPRRAAPAVAAPPFLSQGKPLDVNLAGAAELEKLPGIGPVLAERIIAHRQQYGRFRRVEHLLMVRGFSDKKFRELRELVTVE